MPAFVRALNRVDLPTLGRPTMPHFRLMAGRLVEGDWTGAGARRRTAFEGDDSTVRRRSPSGLVERDRGASRRTDVKPAIDAVFDDRVHAERHPAVHPRIGSVGGQLGA